MLQTSGRAPERAPLVSGSKLLLIGGRWVPAASGREIETRNPATGEVIAHLARGEAEDIDRAVRAARTAFEGGWSRWTPHDRQRLLIRVHDVIEAHFDELAAIETQDMGAPLSRTRGLKDWTLRAILNFSNHTAAAGATSLQNSMPGTVQTMILRAPVGVIGGIIPWNAPVMSLWWIVGGALATGCTVVLKPAEEASLSCLRVAELLAEAGVPDGVVNVVTGWGAKRERPWPRMATWTAWPSPARSRPRGGSSRPLPATSSGCNWNSAASPRTSSSRMPTWTGRCPAPQWGSMATAGRSASPAPGCSSSAAFATSSWSGCRPSAAPCGRQRDGP